MQMRHLGKVYAWFMRRLEAVGVMSGQEKDEREIFLNPAKIEEIQRMKIERKEEKRSEFLDDIKNIDIEKKRFTYKERTVHTDIPPAKLRIGQFKRRDLSAKY